MKESLNVLLVDDNESYLNSLKNYLTVQEKIERADSATNVEEALEHLKRQNYDAVILDLIMPGSDGIALLDEISRMSDNKPDGIVLSSMFHESVITNAVNHGAKYFIAKPINENILYKRLVDMFCTPSQSSAQYMRPVQSKSLDEQIASIFLTIGIPAHIKGYQFLREAVKMVIENPDAINAITKQLYPGIAELFNTTASKVERAIRHAIEVSWARGRIELLNGIFGFKVYDKNDKPTNGEFIALIADKITMDLKKNMNA